MTRFFFVFILSCLSVLTYAFEKDGIAYRVIDGTNTLKIIRSNSNTYESEVHIPETVTYAGRKFTVVEISMGAFYNCKGLHTIYIPKTIKRMNRNLEVGAFEESSVVNVIIDSETSMTEIPFACFKGSKLEKINFPRSITTINKFAFANCDNLTEISIPPTISNIRSYAFDGPNWRMLSISIEQSSSPLALVCADADMGNISYRSLYLTIRRPINYKNVGSMGIGLINWGPVWRLDLEGYGSLSNYFPSGHEEIITINERIRPSRISEKNINSINKVKCKLKVPKDLVELYEVAPYWSEFHNIEGF